MNRLSWPAATLYGALVGVVGALAPVAASAEIYAWVDPDGAVTYSNLPPPKNARVIEVIEELAPPSPQARAAAEAAHQSEMKALNERVQQVERELQQTRLAALPPPMPYPPGPAPSYGPPPGYAPASYGPDAGYYGCDPEYYDCNSWDGPVYYTVGLPYYWPNYGGHRGFRHDHDGDGFHHGIHHPSRFGGGPSFAGGHSVAQHSGGHGGSSGPMARAR